jgi:hypothetical protein
MAATSKTSSTLIAAIDSYPRPFKDYLIGLGLCEEWLKNGVRMV